MIEEGSVLIIKSLILGKYHDVKEKNMKQRILKGTLLSFVVIIFLIGAYLFYNVKIKFSNWYKEKVWNERIKETNLKPI